MKALTTVFVVGMFLTTVAMADDVDDVKALVHKRWGCEWPSPIPHARIQRLRSRWWSPGNHALS